MCQQAKDDKERDREREKGKKRVSSSPAFRLYKKQLPSLLNSGNSRFGNQMTDADFEFKNQNNRCELHLCGDWQLGEVPAGEALCEAVLGGCKASAVLIGDMGRWDSSLAIALVD